MSSTKFWKSERGDCRMWWWWLEDKIDGKDQGRIQLITGSDKLNWLENPVSRSRVDD